MGAGTHRGDPVTAAPRNDPPLPASFCSSMRTLSWVGQPTTTPLRPWGPQYPSASWRRRPLRVAASPDATMQCVGGGGDGSCLASISRPVRCPGPWPTRPARLVVWPDMSPSPPPASSAKNKRSFTGCQRCRRMKIKCDEVKPSCSRCSRAKASCVYEMKLLFLSTPDGPVTEDTRRSSDAGASANLIGELQPQRPLELHDLPKLQDIASPEQLFAVLFQNESPTSCSGNMDFLLLMIQISNKSQASLCRCGCCCDGEFLTHQLLGAFRVSECSGFEPTLLDPPRPAHGAAQPAPLRCRRQVRPSRAA